jgi:hypothetical protein
MPGGLKTDYKVIPASQTDIPFGGARDVLERLVIVPATAVPGAVSIKDGSSGNSITVFAGGTISDLKPMVVELRARAVNGWLITTGANVSVIAVGSSA